jgi:general secretion pathway protein E
VWVSPLDARQPAREPHKRFASKRFLTPNANGTRGAYQATVSSSSLTPAKLAEGLTRDYLLHRRVAPRHFDPDGTLVVAASPDALIHDLDELEFVYDTSLRLQTVPWSEVELLIEKLTTEADREIELARAGDDGDELTTDARNLANQPPVIRYVNLLVREAYDSGASDIHLESSRNGLTVRFRLDGVLIAAPEPPAGLHQAVVSRIKLLAERDIAERRRPQDGRIRVRLGARELDLRVSSVPTMHGESVVLRLLDRGGRLVALDELGMEQDCLAGVHSLAIRPHGMLLVTGPTGSGKTTTLYAALQRRDAASEKIITVEDPIEYRLDGVTQMPLHPEAGVTFATALRSLLRQDPDVLMIGEMRDRETAEIAVQSAMTGHLVFSTLHTSDAVSAVPRLMDLGVPAYLIAATMEGVLAQRLVRRICDGCRTSYAPRPEIVAALAGRPLELVRLHRGAGCEACRGTGFRGRLGIFELLLASDRIKESITRGEGRLDLRQLALAEGMRPLRADGWSKVERGLTTVDEVMRVLGS